MGECYPLDGKRIDLEGVSYFVHGIIHENPLISISNEFKKELNGKLKNYQVICEDGISSWIPSAKSFDETSHFKFNKITPLDYFHFLKGFIYNKFIKKSHKTSLAKKVMAVRKIEDLYPIREELFKNYLNEPEGMNLLISSSSGGTIENPKKELPLRIRRYIYEAKESLSYAKRNELSELHIIVGCAHELPLEYLIKNHKLLDKLSV